MIAGEVAAAPREALPSPARRAYVLILFTIIYALNFVDRQIVTILAPYLKADLAITDAQVGLLFGTAFALFYALFGLPLARLADGWNRVSTLSLGLALWSAMTTVSGFANNFAQLALARVGVGVGEASASPAAISILQDYFPKDRRATALAVYASGVYIGAGASLVIGGPVVAWWLGAFGDAPPLGLAGWQVAYFVVGVPGVLLGLLTWLTVREPARGAIDGEAHPGDPHPFRAALAVLAVLIPPFSIVILHRLGGRKAAMRNLAALVVIVAAAVTITLLTDMQLPADKRAGLARIGAFTLTTNAVQWAAMAIGIYACLSWSAALKRRDPGAARLMLGTPSFMALIAGAGLVSFSSYGQSAFIFLYASRYFAVGPEAGLVIGAIFAIAGGLGTVIGGTLADAARRRHPAGRPLLAAAAVAASTVSAFGQYTTGDWTVFLTLHALTTLLLTMWMGAIYASIQDHVLPQMRGTAVAVQFLSTTLVGLGLGPYCVGLLSDATGDLRFALLTVAGMMVPVVALFLFAARGLPDAERTLHQRAG